MHNTRKIKEDLFWVGANDRRLSLFEGVYPVPIGVSYNSYLLMDEKTVLLDTADKAVVHQFMENIDYVLDGRPLDYLIINHMEPDHCAEIPEILNKFPHVKIVCNAKIQTMLGQFFDFTIPQEQLMIVKEGDTLNTGKHELTFIFAPMVHWPEVMVTYDKTDKILFSADAFGTFGAIDGNIFADEVDFEHRYMDEARRYYSNIVGKYGVQVQALLKKAANLDIQMICPLHGVVWRKDLDKYIDKYMKWSTYTPEIQSVLIPYASVSNLDIQMICPLHGVVWRKDLDKYIDKYMKWSTYTPEIQSVLIPYASVYGGTQNAVEILAAKLAELGVKDIKICDTSVTDTSYIVSDAFKYSHIVFASTTYNNGIFVSMENLLHDIVIKICDTSVTDTSYIVSDAFKYSHIVFASTTYNNGIFVSMENLLHDIVAHNLQNRKIAIIENGSWAPVAGKLMTDLVSQLKNVDIIENKVTVKSTLKENQIADLENLAKTIVETMNK